MMICEKYFVCSTFIFAPLARLRLRVPTFVEMKKGNDSRKKDGAAYYNRQHMADNTWMRAEYRNFGGDHGYLEIENCRSCLSFVLKFLMK